MRVEVDTVYAKAFGALRLPLTPQGAENRLKECYWPNDQGSNVKRIETVIVLCAILRTCYIIIINM